VSRGPALWTKGHAVGAFQSQTGAPCAGIVDAEGGGFDPTLSMGGGAEVPPHGGPHGRRA
jgi:hypothetical protein